MLNVVIFGGPGSGKGTQSVYIAEKYGLFHLSTGDLLRAELKTKSALGQEIDSYISKGNLVPDKLMIDMLAGVLDRERPKVKGFIFDGFPRTLAQAEALNDMLAERDTNISVVLDMDVNDDELVKRLLNRGLTSGRSDDNEETIKSRLNVYHTQTAPVAAFYKEAGCLSKIKGIGTIEEIFGRIQNAIDKVK